MKGILWLSKSYSIAIIRFCVPIPTILSARLMLLTILCRTFSWPYGTDGKNLIVSKKSVLFFLSPHVTLAFDQKLNHWLESLPTECRKIIDMSVSGMKNDEIAKALNISINTVKNQKVKGFKILKELYKDEYLTILFYIFLSLGAK